MLDWSPGLTVRAPCAPDGPVPIYSWYVPATGFGQVTLRGVSWGCWDLVGGPYFTFGGVFVGGSWGGWSGAPPGARRGGSDMGVNSLGWLYGWGRWGVWLGCSIGYVG